MLRENSLFELDRFSSPILHRSEIDPGPQLSKHD
jgi:hypothetical protein